MKEIKVIFENKDYGKALGHRSLSTTENIYVSVLNRKACGDNARTEPCYGRKTKREVKKK